MEECKPLDSSWMDEIRSGEWTAGSIFKNSRDSLANVPSQKGIKQSRPSDLIWTAENRSKGERGRTPAGIEREDGGTMAGPHRSFAKRRFRPRFAMGIARGEREQDCELTTEVSVSGGGTEEAQCSVVAATNGG